MDRDSRSQADYVKRIAEDSKRIKVLEKELAVLKAAAPSAAMHTETLRELLQRLQLTAHLGTLEDEELDVGLLRSMGRVDLVQNMAQLGLSAGEAKRMAYSLFGS